MLKYVLEKKKKKKAHVDDSARGPPRKSDIDKSDWAPAFHVQMTSLSINQSHPARKRPRVLLARKRAIRILCVPDDVVDQHTTRSHNASNNIREYLLIVY